MSEKHPAKCCSAAKHSKHSKHSRLIIDNIQVKPMIFLVASTGAVHYHPQEFCYLSSFAKVSVSI